MGGTLAGRRGQGDNGAMRGHTVLILILTIGFCMGLRRSSSAALAQEAQPRPTSPPAEMRVDINQATIEELLKVPGMTRSWAGRIVRFRPYRTKQDLVEHGVVSGEVYNRIKDYIIAHRVKQ